MPKRLSVYTEAKLARLMANVGDMALKRRAIHIIKGLDLRREDKILDLGCGNGYYLYLLSSLNPTLRLVGLDNDQKALQSAKEKIKNKKKVKLVLGDATRLPFKNNSFDKVLATEVIEHIDNEKQFLSEVYRVLKLGGIFIMTTCNINYPFLWDPINWILQHLFGTHIKSGFWAGIWNQHVRIYEAESLKRLLAFQGYNVIGIKPLTFWCLPFNHYFVNFIARLFYSGKLPTRLAEGINKFENRKQFFLLKIFFLLLNLLDRMNDFLPINNGVSIFVIAKRG